MAIQVGLVYASAIPVDSYLNRDSNISSLDLSSYRSGGAGGTCIGAPGDFLGGETSNIFLFSPLPGGRI